MDDFNDPLTAFEKDYIEYETPEPIPPAPRPKTSNKMSRGWNPSKKKPGNSHRYIKGVGLCTVFPHSGAYKVAADGQFYGPFPTETDAQHAAEMLAPPKGFTDSQDW
jgi:hypothetical protein